ncbi:MAG TPA: isoprenylcysteine carboxylmethyltransferase family protein [Caulobacteraceae bacterium]|nr:isoprenylcysteine carboxylmethyltransferase family protein [Caulobacteraceae bacterium]
MTPQQTIYGFWDAFVVSWAIAAFWRRPATARPPVWTELWRNVVTGVGAIIVVGFAAPFSGTGESLDVVLHTPLWRSPPAIAWSLVVLTAAGFAFSWWARLHLGPLWSGFAGRKALHHIVDTGPYRLVRHPIYTGILTALLAMALLKGTATGLIGLGLTIVGFILKCRLEEGFLRSELGAESYDAYRARTPMLIPFAPRGR